MSFSCQFLTIHPDFIQAYCQMGVFKKALDLGMTLAAINLRDYGVDHRGTIDAPPYGGGDGMVMRVEPLVRAIRACPIPPRVVFPSPEGRLWQQRDAEAFAQEQRPLLFVCGRFAGVDQRFVDHYVDDVYRVGDYVVSGGELPALMMVDSILRLVPGVLGNEQSASEDSFSEAIGRGLEYPSYTRPVEFEGYRVPEELLSGHHDRIKAFRTRAAKDRTRSLRPDLS